jgi:hypothetical protein
MTTIADRFDAWIQTKRDKGRVSATECVQWIFVADPHARYEHKKRRVRYDFTDGSYLILNALPGENTGPDLVIEDIGAEMLAQIRQKRQPPPLKPNQCESIAEWCERAHPPKRLYQPIHYQVWCARNDPDAQIEIGDNELTIRFSDGSSIAMDAAAGYQ